ncbi:uncharacterized protein ACNLHF_026288 [Anomaloglossus baeobatrachus]
MGSQLLIHEDGSPLTRYQYTVLFQRCLTVSGLSLNHFGMHSFRIGAATEAARAGLSDSDIQRPATPKIWIVGHSYVFWAAQRAGNRPGGRNLGFHHVELLWRGVRGLRWSQVLSEVVDISRQSSAPTILVLHAGGNDIGNIRLAELLTMMRSDLDRFPGFFSELRIVWSEIILRVVWQGSSDLEVIDRTRCTVNTRMSRFIRYRSGVVVRHRQLEGDNRRLMMPDGVHLTDIGLDIFLSGIQDGLEQAFFLMSGGRSPV